MASLPVYPLLPAAGFRAGRGLLVLLHLWQDSDTWEVCSPPTNHPPALTACPPLLADGQAAELAPPFEHGAGWG
jgi:hypothetical protein